MDNYVKLLDKMRTINQFGTGIGIIHWDLQTHMPPRGLHQRSEQLAVTSKIMHQMSTDPEINSLLTSIEEKQDSLEEVQIREVELIRRFWNRRSKIPEDLVIAEIKQRTIATSSWKKAKTKNDWKSFEKELEKLLD
ncbi:MAG: hypothetical protein ACTSWA_12470, partial [Candidatus Thorarchaeota archaeon]